MTETLSEFILETSLTSWSVTEDFQESIRYIGFCPSEIYQEMRKREGDKKRFTEDISLLCALFVMRGTDIVKMRAKMSEVGKRNIGELIAKYKIVKKANPGPLELTMSRISALFPHIVAGLLTTMKHEGPIATDLPRHLQFTHAPAIIPKGDNTLFTQWLEWACKFDKVINKHPDPVKVENYALITHESKIIGNDVRIDLMAKLTEGRYLYIEDKRYQHEVKFTHMQEEKKEEVSEEIALENKRLRTKNKGMKADTEFLKKMLEKHTVVERGRINFIKGTAGEIKNLLQDVVDKKNLEVSTS